MPKRFVYDPVCRCYRPVKRPYLSPTAREVLAGALFLLVLAAAYVAFMLA